MFAMAAVALLAVGCQKENGDGLRLIAEGYNSGTKVAVDGNTSTWVDGDMVLINGKEASVSVSGSNATVNLGEGNGVDAPFYGVYPAGIYTSNSGASYTLTLPASYTYSASAGVQHLASPMVGYTENSTSMTFKHLTAAVTVQVVNYHYDYAIVVDSIEVVSNSYKLNGEMTVSIASDITVDPVATDDASLKSVKMLMGSGLTVAVGDSTAVQVPVLPVGDGNKFTVTVWVHRADQASIAVQLTREQTTGGSLLRANLGYARYTIGGPFSVSATKKVVFSKGNLQYQASTNTWRFAEHQYDYIGNASGNITDDPDRATQADWIDLFGWGTGDRPTTISSNTDDYEASAYVDWGESASAYIGSGWHAPSNPDNTYLYNTRSTNCYGLKGTDAGSARFVKAKVNDINGLVVFPDVFIVPDGASVESSTTYNGKYATYSQLVITSDKWQKWEFAGAIFLPAAGVRNGKDLLNYGDYGYYYSSTNSSSTLAYRLYFYGTGFNPNAASTYPAQDKSFGHSVRLVRDVE